MTFFDDFIAQWNGKGLDFDHAFGNQCMDLFEQYNQDVIGAPVVYGNAIDVWTKFSPSFYTQIVNTPSGVPQKGDVMVWGTTIGQYGHIAVFCEGDANTFTSFDQNWPIPSTGSGTGVCHLQQHNYTGVLGWLRPKANIVPEPPSTPPAPPETPILTDQTILPILDSNGQQMELQAVRGELYDKRKAVADFPAQLKAVDDQLAQAQVVIQTKDQQIAKLQNQVDNPPPPPDFKSLSFWQKVKLLFG